MQVEFHAGNYYKKIGYEHLNTGGCGNLIIYIMITEIDWKTIEMQIFLFYMLN
jgi:hypothetical protein